MATVGLTLPQLEEPKGNKYIIDEDLCYHVLRQTIVLQADCYSPMFQCVPVWFSNAALDFELWIRRLEQQKAVEFQRQVQSRILSRTYIFLYQGTVTN